MEKMTKPTKKSQIIRGWHLIDVKDKILGRSATEIANLLMGKNKPYFAKNLDCGDFVVVINVKKVKVTGKKAEKKRYTSYSGFPGGLKIRRFEELMEKNPKKIIVHAVSGMLPKNKLHDKMLNRLYVFEDEEHDYQDKFKAN